MSILESRDAIEHNIISVSGGKDSTALLLLAIERETENMQAVFSDTGNEHEITYEYVQYLNDNVFPIRTIKADFSVDLERKRNFIDTKWREQGMPDAICDAAMALMVPSGNPFLDLCMWKGRFPSTKARFCSEELKRNPFIKQINKPLTEAGDSVTSWQGVRADESPNRALLAERECVASYPNGAELWNYRPILKWTAEDCFAMHRKHGVQHNPLYEQGMSRVGCMPCIHARKDELLEISRRFPAEVARIAEWEAIVTDASKRQGATFFSTGDGHGEGIHAVIEWAKTSRGGTQLDILRARPEFEICTSIYGLCE